MLKIRGIRRPAKPARSGNEYYFAIIEDQVNGKLIEHTFFEDSDLKIFKLIREKKGMNYSFPGCIITIEITRELARKARIGKGKYNLEIGDEINLLIREECSEEAIEENKITEALRFQLWRFRK